MTSFEFRGPVPAGAGPFQRLMAPEFRGKIIDPLKLEFAAAAERAATNVEGVRQELHTLGWGVNAVADAVESLEDQLVPRFDVQVHFLSEQVSLLRSIDASLKNQKRVQAAERIEQSATLLGSQEYEWALKYAQEAIEADATNSGGFIAAGWALIGQRNIVEAINHFVMATKIEKSYRPWVESMRQLARCQLATGDIYWARENLVRAISFVNRTVGEWKRFEEEIIETEQTWRLPEVQAARESYELDLATLEYEASMAAAAGHDIESAKRYIAAAVRIDSRFAKLAVGEPYFEGHEDIRIHALRTVRRIEEERRQAEEKEEEERHRRLAQREAELPPLYKRHESLTQTLYGLLPPPLPIYEEPSKSLHANAKRLLDDFSNNAKNTDMNLEDLNKMLDNAEEIIRQFLDYWLNFKPQRSIGRKYYAILKQHKEKVRSITI